MPDANPCIVQDIVAREFICTIRSVVESYGPWIFRVTVSPPSGKHIIALLDFWPWSGLFGHGLSLFVGEVVELVKFGGFEFKFLDSFFQVVHGLALWLQGLV